MTVLQYVGALRRRWPIFLGIFALVLAMGVALVLFQPKKYTATSEVFVSVADTATSSDLAQGNTFAIARVQSYTDVATSPLVTEPVAQSLGAGFTSTEIADAVTAQAPSEKVIIELAATTDDASKSSLICNAVAKRFISVVQGIEGTEADPSPVKLTLIRPAATPSAPSSPHVVLILVLSGLLGVLLGLAGAVIRQRLDNTIKSVTDLAQVTDIPVLGVIPFDRRVGDAAIAFRGDAHSVRSEAVRQLRTNLQFIDVDRRPLSIAVTSALPGEGKTHAALNLAAALAESGERVCLLEADLRRPTLATLLGIVKDVGLTSVLIGKARPEEVLQNAGQNFAVMTSGPIPPNPGELLGSAQYVASLDYIATQVDHMIIDTAPLLPVADGAIAAAAADATLLSVRSGKTTREQVRQAIEAMNRVGVRPVGIVLSMAAQGASGSYGYYRYSPGSEATAGHDAKQLADSPQGKVGSTTE